MKRFYGILVKPCAVCGSEPVMEAWSSGGMRYALRCDNPDRGNACDKGFYESMSGNPIEAVNKWNRMAE